MSHDQQATRMTPAAFQQWCRTLALAPSTCDYLATIRGGHPVRRVTSRGNSVSGMYPSSKMGVTIQFESHKVELWAILAMDHDPEVLEFFDQPDTYKLRYLDRSGKKIQGHYYTPDFLVLRKTSVCFEEWKTEADLHRLAQRYPARYQQMEDGTWRCPPAEACVEPLGLTFRVHSSAEFHPTYIDNLIFLADYFDVSLSLSARAFYQRIKQRSGPHQTEQREGARAAYVEQPWYWELDHTTPRHGSRPFGLVHIDHTELDIEVRCSFNGQLLGKPWATFMMDAYSRRLLAVYLTFDPPSYRSVMMVLRICVQRFDIISLR